MVPAGNFANASLVGANTVNKPAPFNVSTKSAACTAATKVENWGASIATSTMSYAIAGVGAGVDAAVEAAPLDAAGVEAVSAGGVHPITTNATLESKAIAENRALEWR
mgnify:CR=1 FL=1